MKRVFSLVAALVLVLTSLSGCAFSKKLTAFGLYSRAVNTLQKAGGFEIDSVVTVTFDSDMLEGLDMAMNVNIRQNGGNSRTELSLSGVPVAVTTTIGNDVYVDTVGQKLRYTIAESADNNTSESSSFNTSVLPDIAKELFESLDVVENENGCKSVTLSLEGDTLYELIGQITQGQLGENGGVNFGGAEMTMNFDENNDLDTMKIVCTVSYDILGLYELAGTMTADYKFINLGTAPEVSAPDNADEYTYAGEYQR